MPQQQVTCAAAKRALHEQLNMSLGGYFHVDLYWATVDDPRWQQARVIEEGLFVVRADDAVTESAFRALCGELALLYMGGDEELKKRRIDI